MTSPKSSPTRRDRSVTVAAKVGNKLRRGHPPTSISTWAPRSLFPRCIIRVALPTSIYPQKPADHYQTESNSKNLTVDGGGWSNELRGGWSNELGGVE
jgi:hypothetical protein